MCFLSDMLEGVRKAGLPLFIKIIKFTEIATILRRFLMV